MSIHLIHFSPPFHHCRHYLAYTKEVNFKYWLEDLAPNNCNGLIKTVLFDTEISLQHAFTWPDGDMRLLRKIKKQKNVARYCPICRLEKEKEKGKVI